MDEGIRQRASKQLLKVTFPDGTVFCYKSCRETFIATIQKIGTERLAEIDLQIGHLPIFSKEVYPTMRDYMKPIDDEWYVNVRSGPVEKYLQLNRIKEQLGLDYEVAVGTDFETTKGLTKVKRKTSDLFVVKFPDGYIESGLTAQEVYISAIKRIGLERIKIKSVESLGKEIVTSFQRYTNQIPISRGFWLTVPSSTKDKIKVLDSVRGRLKVDLEIISATDVESYMGI